MAEHGRSMGLDFGLQPLVIPIQGADNQEGRNANATNSERTCFKRKFRWLFDISPFEKGGLLSQGENENHPTAALPPLKGARPQISFKEMEVQHLTETVYFAQKPEWKPITITIYDLKRNKNPIFEWIKLIYDPEFKDHGWQGHNSFLYKTEAKLHLYDGCGEKIETWIWENAWPQQVDFGDLDMASSEVVVADITLRYDRAYIKDD